MHTLKRSAGRKPCKGASQQGSEPHTCSTVSAGKGPPPKMCSGQLMTTSATSCGEPSSVASSSIVSPGLGKPSTSVLIRGHQGRPARLHQPEQQWGSPQRQQQQPAQQHWCAPAVHLLSATAACSVSYTWRCTRRLDPLCFDTTSASRPSCRMSRYRCAEWCQGAFVNAGLSR